MFRIKRLANSTLAIALIAWPAAAAPVASPPAAPAWTALVDAQYNGGNSGPAMSGIGGFWGNGGGFGGGRYNNWPSPPPRQSYQPPVYNTYQPPPQTPPQVQAPPAPVAAETPYSQSTSGRRITLHRPIPYAQPNYLATLSSVLGEDVAVKPAGGTFNNISSGRQLKALDELASGPDTQVTVTLRDGSTLQVSPATQLSFAPLDDEKNNDKALVALKLGEVSAKISLGATRGYNFAVKTERAMVAVREATIVVRHDKRMGVTTIEVSDGVAVVKPANTLLAAINLRAGQQAVIDAENMDAPPAADVADVAATDLPSDTAVDTRTEIASITGAAGADATAGADTPAATDAAAETTALPAPATAADLNGSWLTNDGSVVQLTQSGNQVSW
ncbi:MAG: FecR domain-containing protein, partial [Alphaproteobacteria bacterium]|nr:FecR domain-containing protein [Alphaproteobacteria bacterium]